MSRVLFTHSYFLKLDPKQWKQQQPYAPLGTLTAAAVVREAGHEVDLYDTMFTTSPDEIEPVLQRWSPDYLVIYDDGFNYLTKMCLTNMREAAFSLIQSAKWYGCKVIVSSSDSTDRYQEYLDRGADIVLLGEAEMSLCEVLDNGEPDKIAGIAYLKNKEAITNARRPVMQNLDALPIAAWDLIDMKPYKNAWQKSTGYFSINIATTRGCPYKCNWCAKPIYGNRYNSRSPEHVIAELKMLKEKAGFDHVWFCDDIFGLKPGWVQRFAELVRQENLSFRFKIQSRADLLSKEDAVASLAKAGCEYIWIGAESGSQKILDAMDKGITVEQIRTASHLIRKHGMKPAFFLQFGYPGEVKEDIDKTLKMLFEIMPDDIGVSVSYPLPGTRFYEKVKEELSAKANWTDSDELALMFRNTYSSEYYKKLHRYIHKKFRKKQALNAIASLVQHPFRATYDMLYKGATALYYIPTSIIEGINLKLTHN
jgi:radical SAM superfamily enzyme YgiQ (UPF0313 family)